MKRRLAPGDRRQQPGSRGRPRAEDRRVVNGMVYKIQTGLSWRDLPERYSPWKTVYTRFRLYAINGVFTQALTDPGPVRRRR
ncbi:transposase [Streptomyces lavendulae]|uniref:transposase n=1 Tax=Streptomyces lavendulae TaxID=1914 RepID=UPI0033168B8D